MKRGGLITGLRWKKLPARTQGVVFPMILSLLMSGIVSTIATLNATGLEGEVLFKILRAWGVSYLIAFPTALLVIPIVRRIVAVIVQSPATE